MTQITPNKTEYRLKVVSQYSYELSDLSNDMVMYPYKMERNQKCEMDLVYKTPKGGTTLREYIKNGNIRKSFRTSFVKRVNILDLLLKMN